MQDELIGLVVERKIPILRKHPYFFWTACFAIAVAGSVFFAKNSANPRPYLGLCVAQSAGFLTVPLAFRLCYGIFLEWGKTIESFMVPNTPGTLLQWFRQEMHFFEGSGAMYSAGICLGLLASFAFYAGDYLANYSLSSAVYAYAIIFTTAFLAGIGVFAMCCASRVIWRIGKLRDTSIRVETHKFGILSTGIVLAKTWFIIVLVWCVYNLSAIFGLQVINMKTWLTSVPVWILVSSTLPLIIGSFLVCQIPLHNRMLEYKKNEFLRIENLLQKELEIHKFNDFTEERRAKIDFLERRKSFFLQLPEWPFSTRTLIGLGISTFMPLFLSLLSVVTTEAVKKLLNLKT